MMSRLQRWNITVTGVNAAIQLTQNIYFREGWGVMYFDGWSGFGASAVLSSKSTRDFLLETLFDKVIYIDCSEWKSRRAMQRAIAEELELADAVALLDNHDEDDDFNGVDQSSRDVITTVASLIDDTLTRSKFCKIFLNGTDYEVDVTTFGIPQFTQFRTNRMLWTFKRRFILTMNPNRHSKLEDKLRYTDTAIYCDGGITKLTSSQFQEILRDEAAATVVARNACFLDTDLAMVTYCCLYKLFLHYSFSTTNIIDCTAHASNYWTCDGIIREDRARDISKTLQREINWECDASLLDDMLKKFMKYLEPAFSVVKYGDVYEEGLHRWISITSRNKELHGMKTIPAVTSSFFLAFEKSDHPPALPNGLFEHCNKLGVLSLYGCAFNFRSPSFLKCHSLRFLGLDHCIDDKTGGGGEDDTEWACFGGLWVLDIRYTDWNEILSEERMDLMTNVRALYIQGVRAWQHIAHLLQGRLPNLETLRTVNPTCQWETSKDVDNCFIDQTRLEIVDLSGNSDMKILPRSISKAASLQILVLDGCDGLENIGGLPPSLQSFSFDGYGPASRWTENVELPPQQFRPSTCMHNKDTMITKISLGGCTQLKNLFLRGLPNLVELDLSETSIKILDFKTMVVQVPNLKRLFLIGCEHLRAINPVSSSDSVTRPGLELLCIDTRSQTGFYQPSIDNNKSSQFQMYAVIEDGRLARSIHGFYADGVKRNNDVYFSIHITSSPTYNHNQVLQLVQASLQQLVPSGMYSDVLSMLGDTPMQDFPLPPPIKLDRHVEIAQGSHPVMNISWNYMVMHAESVHVHDVSKSDLLTYWYEWRNLRWCCMERCDTIFPNRSRGFSQLESFWASDLLMAPWIWKSGNASMYGASFRDLKLVHLRSCPRLQFMLNAWVISFPSLETLHIIHCGDLSHIFVLDYEIRLEVKAHGMRFPKLTTIYLHDLPKLQQICDVKMVAPALETIKIRGCWGLRRLPVVAMAARGRDKKKPSIEIEKDVWDALEWDGAEAGHHPDHFEKPVHSRAPLQEETAQGLLSQVNSALLRMPFGLILLLCMKLLMVHIYVVRLKLASLLLVGVPACVRVWFDGCVLVEDGRSSN